MDLGLRGKRAAITGGSVGIGLAIATGLAAEGVDLLLAARDAARLKDEAERLANTYGVRVDHVAADVATAGGCQTIIAAAGAGVDILINNAGAGSNETILEADDAKWQHYWDLHVMSAVRLGRGLAPAMKQRGGGVILHNASICAVQPLHYEPIYNVTKAALMMFSKTLANELVGENIRVNCVNAGLIRTPDWVKTAKELAGENWEAHLQSVADEYAPIKRFGTPEELAHFFVFLCSDKATYSIGSTYFVDGGMQRGV